MIIECEKCNKKFEVQDNLIPDEGRLLKCGTCSHQWHFTPNSSLEINENIDVSEETKPVKEKPKNVIKKIKPQKLNDIKEINVDDEYNNEVQETKKNIGVLSFLLIIIISFIALVIFVDTFKNQLSPLIPNINLYIESLREILKDIFLFFLDLLK
tara:strand:+ start:112 stop:576 length:465 start_codon:yes stop_codon:yes gene_type:complete